MIVALLAISSRFKVGQFKYAVLFRTLNVLSMLVLAFFSAIGLILLKLILLAQG